MDSEWDNDIVENSTGTSMNKNRIINNSVKTNNLYQKIIEDEGRG
jgi:hypothetical protein